MSDEKVAGEVAARPAPPLATLTFVEFSETNRRRCERADGFNHPLSGWSTSDWFLAALGELGEAANIAKKLNRYRDGIPGNKESEAVLRDKLRKELGDVFVYLDLLAQSVGENIGAAAVEVFNAKSEEIGCPIRMPAGPAPIAEPFTIESGSPTITPMGPLWGDTGPLAEGAPRDWQPIETAPKDGTWILAYDPTTSAPRHVCNIVRRHNDRWENCHGYYVPDVTHWRPLPAPPQENKA